MTNFFDLFRRLPQDVIESMNNCMQDPIKHPEGSALTHTLYVFENLLKLYPTDEFLNELLVAAVFHDLGKPDTALSIAQPDGTLKISNLEHEEKSLEYLEKYFDLYSDVTTNKEMVTEIVKYHMRAHLYYDNVMKKQGKRKSFEELKYFKQLMQFVVCDVSYLLT